MVVGCVYGHGLLKDFKQQNRNHKRNFCSYQQLTQIKSTIHTILLG